MRILVLVGSDVVSKHEARVNSGREVVIKSNPRMVARKGDTEVHYFVVRTEHDVDRLRGCRFDLIIEDYSFNPERSHGKGHLLELARMTVLR